MLNTKRKRKAPVSLDLVRSRLALMVVVLTFLGAVLFVYFRPFRSAGTLLNVSYDATREFYADLNAAYARRSESGGAGGAEIVEMSHAGSSRQSQALIRGLMADVVTLATAPDLDAVSRAGLVSAEWRQRFPYGSSPYRSTIVFLTRDGNAKGVEDWSDLAREGLSVVSPDPRVSGAGRLGFLAAWGATWKKSGSSGEADRTVWKIYWKAELVSDGARGVLERFAQTGAGDVLITWESEAHYAVKRYGSDRFQVVYPSINIEAEPVVAVVDRYVDRRGTRAEAQRYLEFLFSPDGQKIAAQNFLRPRTAEAMALPKVPLFTIEEVFGSWDKALARHFAEGGTFNQIARLRQLQRAE
jgi:sulfate/thiosulfate-binding protein